MSGGIAYVYDPDGDFASRCNTSMVALEPVLPTQEQQEKVEEAIWHLGETDEFVLRGLIEKHFRYTGSFRAARSARLPNKRSRFVKVFPHEYRRALKELHQAQRKASRTSSPLKERRWARSPDSSSTSGWKRRPRRPKAARSTGTSSSST